MENPAPNTVTVVGIGTASARADRAELTVGLSATRPTAGDALGWLTQLSHTLIEAIRQAGVGDDDVRTQALTTHPEIDPHSRRTTGFTAIHLLRVSLADVVAAPDLIDAISTATEGAVQVHSIELRAQHTAEARTLAATDAIADATTRARHLAEAAGVRLGPIVSVTELGPPNTQPVSGPVRAYSSAMPIQPGTTEVSASIRVSFLITT